MAQATLVALVVLLALPLVTHARLLAPPSSEGSTTTTRDPPPRKIPCDQPTPRAPVEFPDGVVGRAAHPFKMHSGYVNVTAEDYLFYWHFAAQADADGTAPIILCETPSPSPRPAAPRRLSLSACRSGAGSNGGPGCSAMEGATTEHGPLVLFDIKESVLGHSGQLSANPCARLPARSPDRPLRA